ncbi:MAG: hypothetical protein ABR520_08630 [Mycobacteriales bacterium]|nr:hypothetical protein [Frankia sp.]
MLRKTIATLGMSAAIVVPMSALSTGTAHADTTVPVSGCYGAAGTNLCLSGSVGVKSGTSVPVTTPVDVCVGSCIPAGSPIATVPVPVGGIVTPTIYGTGILSPIGGGGVINAVRDELNDIADELPDPGDIESYAGCAIDALTQQPKPDVIGARNCASE